MFRKNVIGIGAVTNLNGLTDAKFVCAGREFSFIIDNSGKLRAAYRIYATEFDVVDVGVKFRSVVSYDHPHGNSVCFVIDENNDLWNVEKPTFLEKTAFHFTDVTTKPELQLKKVGLKATDIASSENNVACVSPGGILYCWSTRTDSNVRDSRRLDSRGKTPTDSEPTKIQTPEEMAQVALGSNHLLTLGISGTVYSSGKNDLGQLGRPNATAFDLSDLAKVKFPRVHTFVQIACLGPHSVALTASGLVYVWGQSLTSFVPIYWPTCVDPYFGSVDRIKIQSISLSGKIYNYHMPHMLALTQDNKVYAWGKDSLGQCGIRIGFFILRAFL